MLRTSTISHLAALGLLAHAGFAVAQQAATPAPSQAPPKLERIEEGSDTPVTVTAKPAPKKVVEKRAEGGAVTEVKVHSGPSTYTLKAAPVIGTPPPPGQTSTVSPPMWQLGEFDLFKKKAKEKEDEAPASAPPSSAPPAAAPAK